MLKKPLTFNGNLANLPAALIPFISLPRWVCWSWTHRDDRWTKPPYRPLSPRYLAKNNDPATWGTYAEAVAAVAAGHADGIGLMLLDIDLAAGDLDHCRDPETGMVDPWAQTIIDRAQAEGDYIEITVSGTGLRVIGKSNGPALHRRWRVTGREGAGVEVYRNTARYITVSGCEIGHCEQLPETTLIDAIVLQYDGGQGQRTTGTGGIDLNDAGSQNGDIDDIIANGVPEGSRHQNFQKVIAHLAAQGLTIDEIEARLAQHPRGIASKFRGRLRKEIERSYAKWKARHDPGPAAGGMAGGTAGGPGGLAGNGAAPDLDNEPVQWDRVDKNGFPVRSCANARTAVRALNIRCRYDEFHDHLLIEGNILGALAGELSDYACQVICDHIFHRFRFEPHKETVRDAIVQLCLRHRFDPIVEYLAWASLTWDGKERLDNWLSTYLGAADTPLNRAIGRIVLVAAVRRARKPGTKFDQIIVLEGPEGTLKSSAIAAMAGKENFSDQSILGMGDREQQECLRGRWLYEIADLSGIRRAEVEHVKAFASRTHDRARPAYGHFVIDLPRRCVLFATTNDETYLKSQTGNRRFWPVNTTRIDLEALRRDRDQLWAQAARREATGEPIVLPGELWAQARIEQDARMEADPWDDMLADVKGAVYPTADGNGYEERIASRQLLVDVLGLKADRATDQQNKRLAYCMRRLGWKGPLAMKIASGAKTVKGYTRSAEEQEEKGSRPRWAREND